MVELTSSEVIEFLRISSDFYVREIERLNKENSELHRLLEQKPLVFDASCNVPCTAELEVKLGKLVKLLEGDADYYDREYHTYEKEYAKGSAYAYGRAAEKLREILGWDKRDV